MTAIRIVKKIESDTLHLPELKALVGREVEILIQDAPHPPATMADWDAYFAKYGPDTELDPEIYKRQREFDRLHANDHIV